MNKIKLVKKRDVEFIDFTSIRTRIIEKEGKSLILHLNHSYTEDDRYVVIYHNDSVFPILHFSATCQVSQVTEKGFSAYGTMVLREGQWGFKAIDSSFYEIYHIPHLPEWERLEEAELEVAEKYLSQCDLSEFLD
ncbi:MAG: hypothetical protein M0R77_00250 [Gammaproteobacteria bacterium]|nr:hypothetical protein [Acholeplasmataceae bacterium]MCK9528985.1 hypothetical protein [Gammaproteobacteria bacterium]